MSKTIQHYIGGRFTAGTSGRQADVFDPAHGTVARNLSLANRVDVGGAVQAALAAFPPWAETPPLARARVMFRFVIS